MKINNTTPNPKNKREEIMGKMGNKTHRVFYTGKFPRKPKNTILNLGEMGFIEKTTVDNKTFYRIYDIPNDRVIDLRDDEGEIEQTVNLFKKEVINNVAKAYKMVKYEVREFDEGISVFSPSYEKAIDAVVGLDFNGKLIRVSFQNLRFNIPALHRARFEDGINKIEVFTKYRYILDGLLSVIRSKYDEFQED